MSSSGLNLRKSHIPLEEIIRATKVFSSKTQVGEGEFGTVYRGQLSEHWNNRSVAIKRLDLNGCQGNQEFHNELEMVSVFDHPNIIPFIGYCDDANERIIVYEYATNGSLDSHLQDPTKRRCLTWAHRLDICLGAARGIEYLHSGVGEHTRVIHSDLKRANILLDDNLQAKISDSGLSRLGPRNQPDAHVRTNVSGTRFYIDPIYYQRGMLSKESDIYSFGVIMFEMSSGTMADRVRHSEDGKERYLIDLVRSHYDDNELVMGLDKLIDPAIRSHIVMGSFDKFNEIAHECINLDIRKRPTMDRVIKTIREALNIQSCGISIRFNSAPSAAYSDAFWERLLPPDYREVIARAVSPLDFGSPKELYLCLSFSHILLDRGYLSFQLDMAGKKCYMLGAKMLTITWQEDTRYWEWEHKHGSRFPEVCILREVWWLAIRGKIASVMLSQNCTYVAYLVYQTTSNSKGLALPGKTTVKFGGLKMETENVYLETPEDSGISHASPQDYYGFPCRRKDAWMEIKLGEFRYNEGDDGEVKMRFEEIKHLDICKNGLIVEGIEVRPI